MKYIITEGMPTPDHGLKHIGVFDTPSEAFDYAEKTGRDRDFWISEVITPLFGADRAEKESEVETELFDWNIEEIFNEKDLVEDNVEVDWELG